MLFGLTYAKKKFLIKKKKSKKKAAEQQSTFGTILNHMAWGEP
jgi:hypothetical protein